MRGIGRLLAVLTAGMVASMVVAAVAAVSAKRHLVPLEDPEADEVRARRDLRRAGVPQHGPSFRGGTVDCWFGGGAVDLRGATLDAGRRNPPRPHDLRRRARSSCPSRGGS